MIAGFFSVHSTGTGPDYAQTVQPMADDSLMIFSFWHQQLHARMLTQFNQHADTKFSGDFCVFCLSAST